MDPDQARQALGILRSRDGRQTEVILSSGRRIRVWNVAWGCDESDCFDHVTTNISPRPAEAHEIDFIFTGEISAIVDPFNDETLFQGPMGLRALSDQDQESVRRCLEYVVDSDALEDEFETRMGVTEQTVRELLNRWPELDHCGDQSAECAVNNALNEVVHGLRISDAEWDRKFERARADVAASYMNWARSRRLNSTGST